MHNIAPAILVDIPDNAGNEFENGYKDFHISNKWDLKSYVQMHDIQGTSEIHPPHTQHNSVGIADQEKIVANDL